MLPSTTHQGRHTTGSLSSSCGPSVTIACPDARPPAYQAAAGLAGTGLLHEFVTGFYHGGQGAIGAIGERVAPRIYAKLSRRHQPEIPPDRVRAFPAFDVALAVENRTSSSTRHRVARWRTRRFDRDLTRSLRRHSPEVLLAFSDVASEFAMPYCRDAGITTVLSMVHGDVHEEVEVLDREQERSPDFFPIYLGDGPVNRTELGWLHDRRLRDLELSDLILVPSEHIAATLHRHGTDRARIVVVPYAADTRRFVPKPSKRHDDTCYFLFAGGITQRKGIKYLLEAWRLVRRPGWRLGLLGGLPRDTSALEPYRDDVEFLGRVGHSEMPTRMADADVFVFPSLFEGSAVVTYEALACGLPSIVTAESGAVARDGLDGLIVPSADVESLAASMEQLGNDPGLREAVSLSARARAEQFDWPRYHAALITAIARVA
ncbi:MAG: glycosyltransferase [Planctomycetota bacterium]|nr:glycosyltransferase [Planctomycetota bacterium]